MILLINHLSVYLSVDQKNTFDLFVLFSLSIWNLVEFP